MSRARELSQLANENALSVNDTTYEVGINSTSPDADLNVGGTIKMDGPSGVITATSYEGSGANLTGIAATDTIAAGSLTVSGITTLTGAVQAKSTTESTTKDTGGVIVEGGVGIEKNLNIGGMSVHTGITTISATTICTSTTSGALQVGGGVGVGGSVHLGDGKGIILGAGNDLQIVHDHTAGDSYIVDAGTGALKLDASQVVLQHAQSAKVTTTPTGAVVTGILTATGNILPSTGSSQDLGSSSLRWANVYTGDLDLSNEGSSNQIDNTWGSWRIVEGEDDLYIFNKRSHKAYKFNLTEVAIPGPSSPSGSDPG